MKKTSIIITTLLLTISMWGATVKVTYGENITVSPVFTSGDMIEVGTRIDFTAANRETEGYDFVGFFADEDCTQPLWNTYGKGDSIPRRKIADAEPIPLDKYVYTTTVKDNDISLYAKYEQATALINVNDGSDHTGKNINKFFYNGQLIIRKGDKLYNAVGAEL